MKKYYAKKRPSLTFYKGIPKLTLDEKHESTVKWTVRGITLLGILLSAFSLPWHYGLVSAAFLVGLGVLCEKTMFYYTTLHVLPLPEFDYDPEKWVANCFVSVGEPDDPRSLKIVGLVFNDTNYAENFFDLLKVWTKGEGPEKNDLQLSFILDEDTYYLYLFPTLESEEIKQRIQAIEEDNVIEKFGKEHMGLIMQMVICKSFEIQRQFALKMFIDYQKQGELFYLAPFISNDGLEPKPIEEIKPIKMYNYKFKNRFDLNQYDMEYVHWKVMIS